MQSEKFPHLLIKPQLMRKVYLLAALIIVISFKSVAQNRPWDKPMVLVRCSTDVKADMFTATTFIELEFYNPNKEVIEGLYRFELNPGQVITAFQLDLSGTYRDGSIEEKWKATNAYNTIVGKRIDPALLTMDWPGHYSLRIFPVPAGGSRKVTMTIQQLLKEEKGFFVYRMPWNVRDTTKLFVLNILANTGDSKPVARDGLISHRLFAEKAGQYELKQVQENIVLNQPVSFAIPVTASTFYCTRQAGGQIHFALRHKPGVEKSFSLHPRRLVVYWDASASGEKRNINREISFLRQFISYHRIAQLTITPFNHRLLDTAVFYTGNNFNSRWVQYIERINYDGATQLGNMDMANREADMFLIFTDGHNSFGKKYPVSGNAPVYCIKSSADANTAILQSITGSSGGKVIDISGTGFSTGITGGTIAENWLLNITSASGKLIYNQMLPLAIGNPVFISGTLQPGTDTLYFHYGNNNKITAVEKLVVNSEVECAGSALDRISMLSAFEKQIRTYNWNEILDFGIKEKVVTPNTAFIVLERVEDYIKYNIEPPTELEKECREKGFVKKDTRTKREQIGRQSTLEILQKVADVYNTRIEKWGSAAQKIYFDAASFVESEIYNDVSTSDNKPAGVVQSLAGKAAGVNAEGNLSNSLSEVVVTAYGIRREKKMLGYAVQTVQSNEISPGFLTVEEALAGRVAGLDVRKNSMPGSVSSITIRGVSSLRNNSPLYVLDGMPVEGEINNVLNVQDIESISVMKGLAASTLYGSRGANGVIFIQTKKPKYYSGNNYVFKSYRLKDMKDVDYLQELKETHQAGKLEKYHELRAIHGKTAGFYFDMAIHLFESGLKKEAEYILLNAAEVSAGNKDVITAIGYIYQYWNQFDKAAAVFKNLADEFPQNIYHHRDLAWALYQQGQYQQALDILYAAIRKDWEQQESSLLTMKSIMLNEMNSIIAIHRDGLDLSAIPAALIKPLDCGLRIVVDGNKNDFNKMIITEPGGKRTDTDKGNKSASGYVTKDYRFNSYYNYYNPAEYQVNTAETGKYKVTLHYYGYTNSIPSVVRMVTFKNFGRPGQSIKSEIIIMDNQYGEVEIGEVKW